MSTQQQPVVVYPNTESGQQHNPPAAHSNGSFGTVFIVLAVIVAISAIACFLGRLCNRRHHRQRPRVGHREAQPQNHNKVPEQPKEGDIEFGNRSRIQPETQKFRIRPRDEDMNRGGGMGHEQMRNPREGGPGPEFGFDPTRDPREGGGGGMEYGLDKRVPSGRFASDGGGMEFGLDKRAPSGRFAGDGGVMRGFNPSEHGEVQKFGGGDPRAGGAYDHA